MIKVIDVISSIDVKDHSRIQQFEGLMRKFELDKKIFTSYDDELRNPISSDEISHSNYHQLAICFCLQTVMQDDIRFYNTALKISDSEGLQLPEIKL